MPKAELTDKGREAVINAACGAKDSPFVKDGEQFFVRYDAIKFENKRNGLFSGGLNIFFCWRGEQVAKIETPIASLKDNVALTLEGVEGRMAFNIE